jgi:hypothetical protein
MTVSINGHIFDWRGSAADVAGVYETVERLAAKQGLSPTDTTANVILYIAEHGVPKGRVPRLGAINMIVHYVLELDTERAEHPGKFRDYFLRSALDVTIDVDPKDRTFVVRVEVAELEDNRVLH